MSLLITKAQPAFEMRVIDYDRTNENLQCKYHLNKMPLTNFNLTVMRGIGMV